MTVQFETIPTPKGLGDQYFSCESSVIDAHFNRWLSWSKSNTSVLRHQPLKFAGRCACCEVAIPAGAVAYWGKVKDGTSVVLHSNSRECIARRDAINPTCKAQIVDARPALTMHKPALKVKDNRLQYGLMVVSQPPQRGHINRVTTPAVIYL